MRFLIPKNPPSANTSYYTHSDLNAEKITVWFDTIGKEATCKEFTKDQFNEKFTVGKKYPEEMTPWKEIEANMNKQ